MSEILWDESNEIVDFIDSCLERGGELIGKTICKFINPNPDPNILLLGKLAEIGIYILLAFMLTFSIYFIFKYRWNRQV